MSPLRLLLVTAAAVALTASAFGQTPKPYAPPRDAWGRPDLSGTWTNTSVTTLERADPKMPLVVTEAQAKQIAASRVRQEAAANGRTNPEEGAPQAGANVGGYNAFWLDRGMGLGVVKGEPRSSWITDPPNGRMPVSAAGEARIKAILAKRSEDGPEGMNPADRCLVGSRGSGGPPMLNNIYNNTYQFVQTGDHVMIDVEMMHDARVIAIGGAHRPTPVHQWLGDSVGRWEGDTLVVETRNWNPQHGDYEPIYLSEKAVVTERFTRTAEDELTYEFAVDDPGFYSQTWKGEMVFRPAGGEVYEYACHEGNYALQHILTGARELDRRPAGKTGSR
jgi:hypothetical protein